MTISANKENYLKTIFELSYDRQKITNKNIADILQVSAPSVTEMMANLTKSGLVTHTPYNEISLTKEGLTLATELVRKHRIWEVFLSEKLGYGIEEVHQAADTLEHATDLELAERLNKFLDYPKRCPHGGIIPGNLEDDQDADVKILADIPDGQTIKIMRVIDNHEFLMYFSELGLKIDEQLTVLRHQPFDGPIEVKNDTGEIIQISLKSARYIFVI